MQSKMRLTQTARELQNDVHIQESILQAQHRPPGKFLWPRQQESSSGLGRLLIKSFHMKNWGRNALFSRAYITQHRPPAALRDDSPHSEAAGARPYLSPTEAPTGAAAALTEGTAHPRKAGHPSGRGAPRDPAPPRPARTWVYLRKKTPCTLPDTS